VMVRVGVRQEERLVRGGPTQRRRHGPGGCVVRSASGLGVNIDGKANKHLPASGGQGNGVAGARLL